MGLQEALKLLRLELGLSQADLAKALNKACVTVNRWENGKGFPTRANARAILALAKRGGVSAGCAEALVGALLPEARRGCSAAALGFPDIDRDFLFQLADGSANALYVVEAETYRLLYANRRAEQLADDYWARRADTLGRRPCTRTDRRCFAYFGGRTTPCAFCPQPQIHGEDYQDMLADVPSIGRRFRIHSRTADMQGRRVFVIYLIDLTREEKEHGALYALTDDIPAAMGLYNVFPGGRIEMLYMNSALYRMLGNKPRERLLRTKGEADACLVHPQDKGQLAEEIRRSMAAQRDLFIELRMQVRDNRYSKVRLEAKILSAGAEKTTYSCLFREIEKI